MKYLARAATAYRTIHAATGETFLIESNNTTILEFQKRGMDGLDTLFITVLLLRSTHHAEMRKYRLVTTLKVFSIFIVVRQNEY